MTEQDTEQLERLIGKLTEAEKRGLADRLLRSLDGEAVAAPHDDRMMPEQKQALLDFLDEIESLPVENPDDPFSGRDHDKVLYGLDQK